MLYVNVDFVLLSYVDQACGWLSCVGLVYVLLSCALVHDGLSSSYDESWALCGVLSRRWSLLWSLLTEQQQNNLGTLNKFTFLLILNSHQLERMYKIILTINLGFLLAGLVI